MKQNKVRPNEEPLSELGSSDPLNKDLDILRQDIIRHMDLNPDEASGGVSQNFIDTLADIMVDFVEAYGLRERATEVRALVSGHYFEDVPVHEQFLIDRITHLEAQVKDSV